MDAASVGGGNATPGLALFTITSRTIPPVRAATGAAGPLGEQDGAPPSAAPVSTSPPEPNLSFSCLLVMDNPSPGRLLADRLLQMDEARNARPHTTQQPSEMVKERNVRLANQAEKIAALKRAREAAGIKSQLFEGDIMARKRELIDTGTDKRYVRRNERGTSFVESDDVGRSLAVDRRKRAKTKVKSGEGDKGDRPRPKTKRKIASKGRTKAAGRKGATGKSARKRAARKK